MVIDPAVIFLTMLAAAALSLVGERVKRLGDGVAVLSTAFALSGVILNLVVPFTGVSLLEALGFHFTVNGFTSLIALVASLIGFLVTVYSVGYVTDRVGLYYLFTLTTVGSLIGMAYCWNLLWIFLLAEVSTICSAPLIAHHCDSAALEGALKYLIIQIFASLFVALGLGVIYGQALASGLSGVTAFNLDVLVASAALTGLEGKVAVLLVFIGFAAKLPSFPIHTWLPDASTVAPASISTLLHAMMIKVAGMPAFLVLFLFGHLFTSVNIWLVVCGLGALTMLICVILAFAQNDLKRLMAFDSVSQMGYVIMGLGIGGLGASYFNLTGEPAWLGVAAGGLAAGLFHLLNHSLFKSLLFFSAGAIEHETGTRDLNRLGGLLRAMPVTGSVMLVGSLSIAGVPLLNGFNSKWMLYNACIAAGSPLLAFIAIFTCAMTFAVFLRVLCSVFLGSMPETYTRVEEAPKSMLAPSFILAAGCILFGIFPQIALVYLLYPATLFLLPSGTLPPASIFVSELNVFGGLWDPYWLFTLMMVGISVGYLLYRLRGGFRPAASEDKLMPFTGGALHEPYLNIEMARPTSTTFEYPFRSVLGAVRRAHTGLVNLYVLWIVLFALAIMGCVVVGWI